jgi:DNA-binding response OmpR family regulator
MKKPDFVILDLILPGESGFEVCTRFKQTDRFVPVLILSAIELDDSLQLARRVGADCYLTKPFEPDVLLRSIQETAQAVWKRAHNEGVEDLHERRIRFSCSCGKRFKVSHAHRGKTLTCPSCGEPVMVPVHD